MISESANNFVYALTSVTILDPDRSAFDATTLGVTVLDNPGTRFKVVILLVSVFFFGLADEMSPRCSQPVLGLRKALGHRLHS